MSWRSIYISQPAKLSLQQQQLLIQQESGITIPLEDIAVIVVESREVVITAPLLSALAEQGITLLTCNQQFLPCGQWLPFAQYHRSLKILRQQINMSEPLKKQLWQKIVQQKIRNQAWVLNETGHDIAACRLHALADEVKSGDKHHAESQAAALYFRVLFGDLFTRQQENHINAQLNYGYTIIRSAIARSLVQYGLLPTLGIHHHNELNAFNLADDMIEPYRPLVDLAVWEQTKQNADGILNSRTKQQLIALLHHQIQLEQKTYSVLSCIDRHTQSLQIAISEQNSKRLQQPQLLPLKEQSYE